ncbi:restriction endonuclease [bacterium]|nr:restriction endonuclease [bacterium]
MSKTKTISVFEYEKLKKGQVVDGVKITSPIIDALDRFLGEGNIPYYSLIHNGVKFNSYVGVLQVGQYTINILPKADKYSGPEQKEVWNKMLIDMLRSVGYFKIQAPSSSNLKLKPNSILDLYIQLFLEELEYLVRQGLIKQYRKHEANTAALKGSLMFAQHLQKNLVHKERFFVRHTIYNKNHLLNSILFQTLELIESITSRTVFSSTIESLKLHFPHTDRIKIYEGLFNKIPRSRKTEPYSKAIEIAKLLLLNYHPDINKGKEDVLALMFDMNVLWEEFVLSSLKRNLGSRYRVQGQKSKNFWKRHKGATTTLRPDILITDKVNSKTYVLDTKWKNLGKHNPNTNDLRQMFTYIKYFGADKAALIYPGPANDLVQGTYYREHNEDLDELECGLMMVECSSNIREFQKAITSSTLKYLT